jgi:hypothetical protein
MTSMPRVKSPTAVVGVKRRLHRYAQDAGRLDRLLHPTPFEQDVRLLGHAWSPSASGGPT